MNITKAQIKIQFNRAKKLGWLPYFAEAAATITKGYFDESDLLGIASRETNLDPKWLTKMGDNGNGAGLMQIDKRSFPKFTKSDDWKDARSGIRYGAAVLMDKWDDYVNNIGKRLTVKSSKNGTTYRYTAQKADGANAQRLVISSFNCGRWSQYALANNQDIDKYSTGGDYAKDVMERARVFRSLLKQDSLSTDKDGLASSTPTAKTAGEAVETRAEDEQSNSALENISGEGEMPTNGSEAGEKLSPPPSPDSNTVVAVQQAEPAKSEPDTLITKFKAWYLAIPAGITAYLSAAAAWAKDAPANLVIVLLAIAGAIVVVYVVCNLLIKNRRETRENELKLQREQQAHAITMTMLNSAASRDLNTVRLVPNDVENSDTKEPKMFAGGVGGSW